MYGARVYEKSEINNYGSIFFQLELIRDLRLLRKIKTVKISASHIHTIDSSITKKKKEKKKGNIKASITRSLVGHLSCLHWVPPPRPKRASSSMAMKINPNFAIVVITILLLSPKPSNARDPPSAAVQNPDVSIFSKIKYYFFPIIEITLFNEGEHDILYTCNLTPNATGLYVLRRGDKFSYSFTQVAFPMRWCYLYINDQMNGFFWSYNVRLRCTKCFWSIRKYPYLYRSDRTRWERQQLFMPQDFDIDLYKKETKKTTLAEFEF